MDLSGTAFCATSSIPCSADNAGRIKAQYDRHIDCEANITCICPTCHRAVHCGDRQTRQEKVTALYTQQSDKLTAAGIPITLDELLAFYKVRPA